MAAGAGRCGAAGGEGRPRRWPRLAAAFAPALASAGLISTCWLAAVAREQVPDAVVPPGSERSTPEEAWRADEASWGTPVADEDTVYLQSRGGELVAIDRVLGTSRWRRRTSPPGFATAGSAVRLWQGLVIAGDEALVAFEARTGAPAWRFTPEAGYGVGHYLGPVASGLVLAGSPSGKLFAVDAATGRERWSAAPQAPGPVTVFEPAIAGGIAVAGYHAFTSPPAGGVFLVGLEDGRTRWSRPLRASDGSAFTAGWAGGLTVFGDVVVATARDGAVWALDVADGDVRWVVEAPEPPCGTGGDRPDLRPLVPVEGRVIAGSTTGCVTALDLATREVAWRFRDVRLGSTAVRIAADGRFAYVPFLSGRLVALDARTGEERWRLGDATRQFVWTPALAGRRLFLTSPAGVFSYGW